MSHLQHFTVDVSKTIPFQILSLLTFAISLVRRFLINIIQRKCSLNRVLAYPICQSVCLSDRKVYCGKTADWIRMPFGVFSGIGRGMGVLHGGNDRRRGRGSFGGEFGASHCNQWGRRCTLPKFFWGSTCYFNEMTYFFCLLAEFLSKRALIIDMKILSCLLNALSADVYIQQIVFCLVFNGSVGNVVTNCRNNVIYLTNRLKQFISASVYQSPASRKTIVVVVAVYHTVKDGQGYKWHPPPPKWAAVSQTTVRSTVCSMPLAQNGAFSSYGSAVQ